MTLRNIPRLTTAFGRRIGEQPPSASGKGAAEDSLLAGGVFASAATVLLVLVTGVRNAIGSAGVDTC
jgi:hypothetical protein